MPPSQDSHDRARPSPARPQPPSGTRAAWHLLLLLPLSFLLWSGLRGVDFGHHWDEAVQIENTDRAIENQTLLPKWYRYPSMLFWMTFASLGPELLEGGFPSDGEEMRAKQDKLSRVVRSEGFKLRLRGVFLLVTALTLIWTYVAAFLWRRNPFEALTAASFLALSWELGYHARWVAPDGVLMQFSALTLMFVALATSGGKSGWLFAAAVAAGLGCGTKYTGGILLLPVLLAAWSQRSGSHWQFARNSAALGLVFLLSFVLTTPGAVLQPFVFVRHIGFEIEHYRSGHYGATIEAGGEHLGAMLRYLSAHLFSHHPVLSLAIAACGIFGLISLTKRAPAQALWIAAMPILYVVYMSTQRVMFVRNLLLIAPPLALLAAQGVGQGLIRIRRRGALAWGLILAVLWSLQAPYLWRASESIRVRGDGLYVQEAYDWIQARPDQAIFITGRVQRKMVERGLEPPSNTTRQRGADVEAAVFFPTDTKSNAQLIANRPGTALAVFGPLDVNFPYYPAWANPKIVAYPAEAARQAGLLAEQPQRAREVQSP